MTVWSKKERLRETADRVHGWFEVLCSRKGDTCWSELFDEVSG